MNTVFKLNCCVADMTFPLNICFQGGHGRLDIQPSRVTALAWPQSKGLVEGCLGLSVDSLLIGRHDGSIGVIEAIDSLTFCRKELRHCGRNGGM